ncbi:SpoIIE family protein phosphatase [Streptomyces sp. NPDC046909]|uniref:SpoIIE family protein phosphatase n=1 Tax=Streptomyces sp. NPDC046909 TaxID=3155617 RepID=UPI0033E22E71
MTKSDEPPYHLPAAPPGAIVETTAALAVTDTDGRVTLWSQGAQALWGYASKEAVGMPLAGLFTSAGGQVRHRDGRPVDARVRLTPLQDSGRAAGFLLTALPGSMTAASGDDALKQLLFDQYPVPLGIFDRDARAVFGNETMQQVTGLSEDDVRGRLPSEYFHGTPYEELTQRIRRSLLSGEQEFYEHLVRLPGETRMHAWALDIFPLRDAFGRVQGAGVSAYDYSQQYDSRERLALMSEARSRIGGSLDVAGTATELAEVVVPRFANVVTVELLDPVFHGELPAPVLSGPVLLRRAAFRAASPLREPAVPDEVRRHSPSSPIARCLISGQAELHHITAPDITRWFADDPDQAELFRAGGVQSLIAMPIRARETLLGAVLFTRGAGFREPFTTDDLAVTEDLVARAAVCLDNARRFARERGIALALQRTLLPRGRTVHPAVETSARYLPAGDGAQAGGDWFDVIPLPGARVGLVVGDVVGHGVSASATMGRLRTAVRTLADIDLPPDELLTHLDDIVTHAEGEPDDADGEIPGDIGASCLYAVYDPLAGTCTLARAGHPAPILVHPDGTSTVIDLPAGPPLGLGSLPFEAVEVTMPEGSLLALFTDGLLATGDQDLDKAVDTLRNVLSRPAPSLEALGDTVLAIMSPKPHADDVALLLARTRILGEDRVASWDVPVDPAAVADMRRRASDQLTTWGLEESAFVTELVVSELVTNAIRHAKGPIRLRIIKDKTLICEVSDGSSTSPHLRRARLSDEGGRGLFMVAELTRRWGTRHTRTGKTIWAEQPIGSSR